MACGKAKPAEADEPRVGRPCTCAGAWVRRSFREAVDAVTKPPMPELEPEAAEVWSLWQQLGRDANGSPLLSEQRECFAEYGVSDDDMRESIRHLWSVITSVMAECAEDEREQIKAGK